MDNKIFMNPPECNCNEIPPHDRPPVPPCPPKPYPPCPPCPPPCPPRPVTTYSTPNYHLPQWKASDVTSWLTQMNMAMMQIDTALHKLALSTGVDGVPQELIEQITKLEEAVTLLENMYTAVDNRTENLNQLVTNINTIIANLQTTMQTLTTNFVNLDTRFTTVELQANNAVEKVNKMEVNLNTTIKTVDDLKNRVVQLETTSASHQATLDAIEEEIQNLQNKNDKQDSSISELKAADKVHDSSITELRAKNSTQDSEIELLKGRMQTAEGNITVTSSSVSANTQAIETLKGVDTQLTGRLNGIDNSLDSHNTRILNLGASIGTVSNHLSKVEKTHKNDINNLYKSESFSVENNTIRLTGTAATVAGVTAGLTQANEWTGFIGPCIYIANQIISKICLYGSTDGSFSWNNFTVNINGIGNAQVEKLIQEIVKGYGITASVRASYDYYLISPYAAYGAINSEYFPYAMCYRPNNITFNSCELEKSANGIYILCDVNISISKEE